MEIDKIEAFDYMLHLFEKWRDNHETIKGKPFPKLTALINVVELIEVTKSL